MKGVPSLPDSTVNNAGSQNKSSRLEKSKHRLVSAMDRLEKALGNSNVESRLGDLRSENAALRDAASTVSNRLDKVIDQLKANVEQN